MGSTAHQVQLHIRLGSRGFDKFDDGSVGIEWSDEEDTRIKAISNKRCNIWMVECRPQGIFGLRSLCMHVSKPLQWGKITGLTHLNEAPRPYLVCVEGVIVCVPEQLDSDLKNITKLLRQKEAGVLTLAGSMSISRPYLTTH